MEYILRDLSDLAAVFAIFIALLSFANSIITSRKYHIYEHLLRLDEVFPFLSFINFKRYDKEKDKFYILDVNLGDSNELVTEREDDLPLDVLDSVGYSFCASNDTRQYHFTFRNISKTNIHKVSVISFVANKKKYKSKKRHEKIDYATYKHIYAHRGFNNFLKYLIEYKITRGDNDYKNMLNDILSPDECFHFFVDVDIEKYSDLVEFAFVLELKTIHGAIFYEQFSYSFNEKEYKYSHKNK